LKTPDHLDPPDMSFGPHVNRDRARGARPPIVEHIAAAVAEAEDEAGFDITAVAIFVGGPKNREITLRDDEADALREYAAAEGIRVIAHSTYGASPWRGDPDAARFIRAEAAVCQRAGIRGLVVHLPKLPPAQVLRYIPRLVEPTAPDVRIYLETPAVNPKESYYETPEKLGALFRGIRALLDPELLVFGLCVDSAHLWTCGVDVSGHEAAEAWLAGLAREGIPPDRVMLHLNDSARGLGVGPDTHAALGAGRIWADVPLAESGLAAFVEYAQRGGVPAILERKPNAALLDDYAVLRRLGV
jgi:endonuclease IV